MCDERHPFLYNAIDVLQHIRILVHVQTQIVPPDTRVLRPGIFAKALTAENIILNPGYIGNVDAWLEKHLSGLLGFVEDREGALLFRSWFAQNQGSANLCVISIDLRTELGRHVI